MAPNIQSSNVLPWQHLPEEKTLAEAVPSAFSFEKGLARLACLLLPLTMWGALWVGGGKLAYLVSLNFDSVPAAWGAKLVLKCVILIGLMFVLPGLWLVLLSRYRRSPCSPRIWWFIAPVLGLFACIAAGQALNIPKILWTFSEATKLRLEIFSHPRSVASWLSSNQELKAQNHQLMLIGSSQINAAANDQLLQHQLPQNTVQKRCTPGFHITQYVMALPVMPVHGSGDTVVCWISEFDTFREGYLPVSRLRLFANFNGLAVFMNSMTGRQVWQNREEFADLFLASALPLCQKRDMLRPLVFNFWWRIDESKLANGLPSARAREEEIQWVREQLGKSVRRTELTEVNFKAFEAFAAALKVRGVRLLVVEGQTNPQATDKYPAEYRKETRERLRQMSEKIGFTYLDENQLPRYQAADFKDATHLNEKACQHFTEFLAAYIRKSNGNPKAAE